MIIAVIIIVAVVLTGLWVGFKKSQKDEEIN